MNLVNLLSICLALKTVDAGFWAENFADFPKKWPNQGKCKDTCAIIANPAGDSEQLVMWAKFPAGSCSSACGIDSGVSVYVKPVGNFTGNEATLEYEVYFPNDFEFVNGGKLPGIAGGPKGCSGCTREEPLRSECFTARFRWGEDGEGSPYLYLPLNTTHTKDFCAQVSGKSCDPKCGLMFNTGKSFWLKGRWNTVKQRVVLNTIGQANGVLQAWINGVKRIDFGQMIWRINSNVKADGFLISSHFGGSDASYAPPMDTYVLFRNFKFYDHQ